MQDFSALPEADQRAIGKTLFKLLTALKERNADLLVGVYSDDADWVNGYGISKHGAGQIIDCLRGLFADKNFYPGGLAGPPDTAFRVVTPEVVLVSVHIIVRRLGGDGGGRSDRHSFVLMVLQRQNDGSWRIISEMYQEPNAEIAGETVPVES